MAEAKQLPLALDEAKCQLAKLVSGCPRKEHLRSISAICSPVAAAVAVEASNASYVADRVASLLESNIVSKLTSFLEGTLTALGNCTLFSASDEVQATWELVLHFLLHLGNACPVDQTSTWSSQLLDAGKEACNALVPSAVMPHTRSPTWLDCFVSDDKGAAIWA
jgi:hypothetical protein